ncbi:MAG: thiol-disulfide oxidoreductase [Mailhella sp.]|nr:thiol-disulfide oxidoreductase [Mailhella sp.]
MSFVVVPHPIGMIPKNEVEAKIDAAFDGIIKAALEWKPNKENAPQQLPAYPAKTFKFTGTYAEVNSLFTKRNWSLSLPIVPPTFDKVQEMLKGTTRDPSEVVWVVPPRQGMLTVELVATLGVMAGARPEHMPLLLAAVEAMADPDAAWRGTSTTTAPTVPIFILSGPVIDLFKLNSGTGTAGAENAVTNALGYFVNLVGDVVGGSVPPNGDKSTHGTSADIVAMVFCENAKANPWKTTFAEMRGFKPTDSVISLATCYIGSSNIDHDNATGEGLLTTLALNFVSTNAGNARCLTDFNKQGVTGNEMPFSLIILAPEHANTIWRDFPKIEDAQKFLVDNAVMPYKYYGKGKCNPPASFGKVTPDTLIPRFVSPESAMIIVSGGPGKQSQVWPPFPQVWKPVSKIIKDLPEAK